MPYVVVVILRTSPIAMDRIEEPILTAKRPLLQILSKSAKLSTRGAPILSSSAIIPYVPALVFVVTAWPI